jgi:endonuclease/exonuclease/phosphatase family metal-dependent hydrolase
MAIWTIRGVRAGAEECLLAGVHLTSKAGGTRDDDQLVAVIRVIDELGAFEDEREHRNTAIVGDFNMNPFDPGMTSVAGVHGLMTRRLAERQDRKHQGRYYRRFYNPMWGFFGDRTPGPAGSYYWRKSAAHNQHWQMFDQVLVRSGLMDRIDSVSILDSDGDHSLLKPDGTPDRDHFSDHLPIVFSLDI